MARLRLSWGPWGTDDSHGYAYVASRFPQALTRAGVDVCDPYDPHWDLFVAVSPPISWFQYSDSHRLVMHTMYEASPLPPYWVQNLNHAGLIWTPSQWCADLFRAQGVTRPIMVAGYGLDPAMIAPVDRSGRSGPLRIALWGDTLFSRKNVWEAIQAFVQADLPDAVLEVKLSGLLTPTMRGTVADLGWCAPNVTIIADLWPAAQIVAWLQQADVGLYLSRGEGFGMIPLQMMATGLPIICADNTGMREYVTPETAILIPCTLAPASPGSYAQDTMNYAPDMDATIAALRWVAAHRDSLSALGQRAAAHAATFTWERAAAQARVALEAYWVTVAEKSSSR